MTDAIAAELTAEGLWVAGYGAGTTPLWQEQGAGIDALPGILAEQSAADLPVLIAGAGGARVAVPCAPLGTAAGWEASLPGAVSDVSQWRAQPMLTQTTPPVLSGGAEFRIAGFLDLNPEFDGVLCLPGGDTTLWALISAEEVVSLSAFRSGALATALGELGASAPLSPTEEATFAEAAADTLNRPERLAARLAEAHAARALGLAEVAAMNDRIAGALLGAELAASRAYWLGQNVAVLGAAGPARAYAQVLGAQGLPVLRAELGNARSRGARKAVTQALT